MESILCLVVIMMVFIIVVGSDFIINRSNLITKLTDRKIIVIYDLKIELRVAFFGLMNNGC